MWLVILYNYMVSQLRGYFYVHVRHLLLFLIINLVVFSSILGQILVSWVLKVASCLWF